MVMRQGIIPKSLELKRTELYDIYSGLAEISNRLCNINPPVNKQLNTIIEDLESIWYRLDSLIEEMKNIS